MSCQLLLSARNRSVYLADERQQEWLHKGLIEETLRPITTDQIRKHNMAVNQNISKVNIDVHHV